MEIILFIVSAVSIQNNLFAIKSVAGGSPHRLGGVELGLSPASREYHITHGRNSSTLGVSTTGMPSGSIHKE